ncbi:MAG: helix-turn-helix domain-containing protein [Methanoregulaceae archaeon]|nr:helix-turn-helix domain-containing protein [Methanoregulaceae archaeon]
MSEVFSLAQVRGVADWAVEWMFTGEIIALQRISAEFEDVHQAQLKVAGRGLVSVRKGTAVIGGTVFPSGHLGLLKGGTHRLLVSASEFAVDLVTWNPSILGWLDILIGRSLRESEIRVAPGQMDDFDANASPTTELGLAGHLLTRIAGLLQNPSRISIRPTPAAEGGPFAELLEAVETDPAHGWNLTEAADQAGYSSFHFSRTFKQQVGCGFHEYLDRRRTEVAVMRLAQGGSVAEATELAGFSSARSLRESLRDYLGLRPTDFRTD